MVLLLGYYDIRGLGQFIRFFLEYTGIEYEEKLYRLTPPQMLCQEWTEQKGNLGLDFPNLPYLIDGDFKLTQSVNIMKYIAEKAGFKIEEADKYRIQMLEGHIMDIRMRMGFLSYNSQYEKWRAMYEGVIDGMIRPLSTFLGDKKWLLGDNISYLDFIMYEAVLFLKVIFPECLKKFDSLQKHLNAIENLEAIKEYMKSPKYIHRPFGNPTVSKVGNE